MKTFLIATALLAAAATSATAMTVRAPALLPAVDAAIERLVPSADVQNLRGSQIAALNGLFVNSNDLRNDIDRKSYIRAILDRN